MWDVDSLDSDAPAGLAKAARPKAPTAVVANGDAQRYNDRVLKARPVETDLSNMGWWAKPMLAAVSDERLACGRQQRTLVVATACSGTESPLFGFQAHLGAPSNPL